MPPEISHQDIFGRSVSPHARERRLRERMEVKIEADKGRCGIFVSVDFVRVPGEDRDLIMVGLVRDIPELRRRTPEDPPRKTQQTPCSTCFLLSVFIYASPGPPSSASRRSQLKSAMVLRLTQAGRGRDIQIAICNGGFTSTPAGEFVRSEYRAPRRADAFEASPGKVRSWHILPVASTSAFLPSLPLPGKAGTVKPEFQVEPLPAAQPSAGSREATRSK
jgi:hypothetical protein